MASAEKAAEAARSRPAFWEQQSAEHQGGCIVAVCASDEEPAQEAQPLADAPAPAVPLADVAAPAPPLADAPEEEQLPAPLQTAEQSSRARASDSLVETPTKRGRPTRWEPLHAILGAPLQTEKNFARKLAQARKLARLVDARLRRQRRLWRWLTASTAQQREKVIIWHQKRSGRRSKHRQVILPGS